MSSQSKPSAKLNLLDMRISLSASDRLKQMVNELSESESEPLHEGDSEDENDDAKQNTDPRTPAVHKVCSDEEPKSTGGSTSDFMSPLDRAAHEDYAWMNKSPFHNSQGPRESEYALWPLFEENAPVGRGPTQKHSPRFQMLKAIALSPKDQINTGENSDDEVGPGFYEKSSSPATLSRTKKIDAAITGSTTKQIIENPVQAKPELFVPVFVPEETLEPAVHAAKNIERMTAKEKLFDQVKDSLGSGRTGLKRENSLTMLHDDQTSQGSQKIWERAKTQ